MNGLLRTVKVLLLGLPIFLFIQCTGNPFFEDGISEKSHRIINGKVLLSDETNPADVYVWLEGFNLSTYTDQKGNFEIELPQAKAQPGAGLTGIFSLYCFLANYEYHSSSVLLLNGSIEYGKGDLNANGEIRETIVLNKMLDIELTVVPNQIPAYYKDPVVFKVKLKNLIDTVIVKTHHNQWGVPSSLFFLEQGAPAEQVIFLQGYPAELRKVVITEETEWINSFLFTPNFFGEGNYEVRPYLQIIQEGLPDALLRSIDEELYETTPKYLLLPIRIEQGILYVSEL